jgi:hypothetical protein
MKYYVVGIYGDIEPIVSDPFETEEERDEYAREMYSSNETDGGGIFRLDIDENGIPSMDNYSENELN